MHGSCRFSEPTDSVDREDDERAGDDANDDSDADAISDSPVRDTAWTGDNDGDVEEGDSTCEANKAAAGGFNDDDGDKAPLEAESVNDDKWDVADPMGVEVVASLTLVSENEFKAPQRTPEWMQRTSSRSEARPGFMSSCWRPTGSSIFTRRAVGCTVICSWSGRGRGIAAHCERVNMTVLCDFTK